MKKRIVLLLMVMGFLYGSAHAQTGSKNLSLSDYINYLELYQSQVPDTIGNNQLFAPITDLASWEDTRTGKEYALICLYQPGSGSGVAMVDVSDPGNAFYEKTIRHPDPDPQTGEWNTPHDIKVHNDIAYVGQNGNVNAHAYWVNLHDAVDNTTIPTAGVKSDGFGILDNLDHDPRIHNVHVNAVHDLLFMSDFKAGEFGVSTGPAIQVFDISGSPPVHVDSIPMFAHFASASDTVQYRHLVRNHDLYAFTKSSNSNSNEGRIFGASMAAVTIFDYSWNDSNFSVDDKYMHVFNPRRGQDPDDFTSELIHKQVHSTWMGQNPDLLYTTVEGSGGNNQFDTWVDANSDAYQRANYMSVWDISNIEAPPDDFGYRYNILQVYEVRENTQTGDGAFNASYFSSLNSGGSEPEKANSIHNIHTQYSGFFELAYVSYYTRGIRVLDVTNLNKMNPGNIDELAFYNIPGLEEYEYPAYNAAFGVDSFLLSGTILGSSSDGLYVFRPVGMFGGPVAVPTRWTTGITVVEDLFVEEVVTVQGDVTISLKADMELNNDIAMTEGSMITLASAEGISTITSGDGVKTIGVPGTGGSARMDGGSGPGGPISPLTEELVSRPGRYHLAQNYPNPFNPVTVISYELPVDSKVRLEVYDILGRRVTVLVSEIQETGTHQATWDASNAASGVYIYRLRAGDFVQSRQMLLVK